MLVKLIVMEKDIKVVNWLQQLAVPSKIALQYVLKYKHH